MLTSLKSATSLLPQSFNRQRHYPRRFYAQKAYLFGNLGLRSKDSNSIPSTHPLELDMPENVKCIGGGVSHFLFLTESDNTYGIGKNDTGQLGEHVQKRSLFQTLTIIPSLSNVKLTKIECGRGHSIAITDSGACISFGSNETAQLGNGEVSQNAQERPIVIPSLVGHKIKNISTGFDHSLALDSNGYLKSWGLGLGGQIGDALQLYSNPIDIEGLSEIVDICCGVDHNLGKDIYGNVWIWGTSDILYESKLDVFHIIPTKVIESMNVKKIEAGDCYSMVLNEEGDVYVWGKSFKLPNNEKSDLGLDEEEVNDRLYNKEVKPSFSSSRDVGFSPLSQQPSRTSDFTSFFDNYDDADYDEPDTVHKHMDPTKIPYFHKHQIKIKDISAGSNHMIALSEDGSLYSWGFGGEGRLGHLDEYNVHVPKKIEFFEGKNIKMIKAAFESTIVICEED